MLSRKGHSRRAQLHQKSPLLEEQDLCYRGGSPRVSQLHKEPTPLPPPPQHQHKRMRWWMTRKVIPEVMLTQIYAYAVRTHKDLVVRKIMEVMHTAYAKSEICLNTSQTIPDANNHRRHASIVKRKRAAFAKHILFCWVVWWTQCWGCFWNASFISLFLFIGMHFWIFERQFLLFSRASVTAVILLPDELVATSGVCSQIYERRHSPRVDTSFGQQWRQMDCFFLLVYVLWPFYSPVNTCTSPGWAVGLVLEGAILERVHCRWMDRGTDGGVEGCRGKVDLQGCSGRTSFWDAYTIFKWREICVQKFANVYQREEIKK